MPCGETVLLLDVKKGKDLAVTFSVVYVYSWVSDVINILLAFGSNSLSNWKMRL